MDNFNYSKLTIYRSIYAYINSNMYVMINGKNAIVIDPHEDNDILKILADVTNITILLTHEHPDHISGIHWFQEKFNCKIYCTKSCADYISQERNVRPILITFVLEEHDRINGTHLLEKFNKEFVPHTYLADIAFEDKYEMSWCEHNFKFFNILGHSKGSCVIIIDEKYIFTGDTLLKDFPVIVRFPGGNKKIYLSETIPFLEDKLKPDMNVFPGHGDPFLLSEIMKDGKLNVEIR